MPLTLNGTTGEVFPSWTTGTRPSSPVAGQTGYNSSLATLETYNGSAWVSVVANSDGQIVVSAGTASLPGITTTGDTNTGIFFPAADTIAFAEGGSESARIDSSGNLQIGMTDLSSYTLYTKFAVKLGNGQGMGIISAANTDNAYFAFGYGYASDAQQYSAFIARKGQDVLSFGTGNVERARINANGEMITGGTTDNGAYNLQCNGTSVWGAGAYVNGSDERIKDNIQDIASCVDVVMSLRPVTFQYKPEFSKDTNVQPGFIAQDLQQALAGQVYEAGVVMEGPEYLSVAYQSLIPVLTKAIQELSAKLDAAEARIAALEGAK